MTLRQKTPSVCDWFCSVSLAAFCCYIFSLLIYAFFIAALIRYRKAALRTSFYAVCLSLSAANAWGIVHKLVRLVPNFLDVQDFYLSLGRPFEFFLRVQFTYTSFSSMIGYSLLTFNLYSAIVYPMRLNSWWSPTNLRRALIAQWLLPLGLVALLFLPIDWDFDHIEFHRGKYSSFAASELYLTVWLGGWALFQMIISVVFIGLYTSIVKSLWRGYKLREKSGSMRSTDAPKTPPKPRPRGILERASSKAIEKFENGEVRLAVAGLFMSFLQVIVGVHASFAALELYRNDDVQEVAHTFVHGLYLQANPYILLFMSGTVRQCLVGVCKCQKVEAETSNNA